MPHLNGKEGVGGKGRQRLWETKCKPLWGSSLGRREKTEEGERKRGAKLGCVEEWRSSAWRGRITWQVAVGKLPQLLRNPTKVLGNCPEEK